MKKIRGELSRKVNLKVPKRAAKILVQGSWQRGSQSFGGESGRSAAKILGGLRAAEPECEKNPGRAQSKSQGKSLEKERQDTSGGQLSERFTKFRGRLGELGGEKFRSHSGGGAGP